MKRRNALKYILAGLFLVLLVEVILLSPTEIRGPNEDAGSDKLLKSHETDADSRQAMQGVHLVETGKGQREWELWADRANSPKQDEKLWLIDKVRARFFSSDGQFFTVTGDKGEVSVDSQNMRVEGNVVTKSSNGYVFRTKTVTYNSHLKHLESPSHVDMIGPPDRKGYRWKLGGQRMLVRLQENTMDLVGLVRGTKRVRKNADLKIRSDEAQFNTRTEDAVFRKDVVMDYNDLRIAGPTAKFSYSKSSEQVQSILVDGGVRVNDANKWATSQQLLADLQADRLTFQGHPRVVQDSDELIGEQIVFMNGGKKVKVVGAEAKFDESRLENR